MTLFVFSVCLALFVSALCSVMEATLLSLTPSQVAQLSQRRPKLGLIWQDFKSRIDRPIAAILLINTAAHTIGASIAGSQFDELFGDEWILVFSLVFTYLMLQFTEILPKTLGVKHNRFLARLIARPLATAVTVLAPVLYLVQWVPFKGRQRDETTPAAEEIAALAGAARLSKQISSQQERIIKGGVSLSQLDVRNVMLPSEDISFLSTAQTTSAALITAHLEAHTRFPICEGDDRDRVVGYVNFKELVYHLRVNPHDSSLAGIIRPIHFVAPDDPASDLLKAFVEQHVHMAIVRDGDGRTLGLVTLEDLVEEFVGELEDEFDRLPRMFHALRGGIWMIGGGTPMSQVASKLQLAVPNEMGSVSAWLLQRCGRVPKPGDQIQEGGIVFTVRRVRRGKIFEVAVSREEQSTP